MKPNVSRRKFLTAAAAAPLLASAARADEPAKTADYSSYLINYEPADQVIEATEKDIEGPFYRDGAPLRSTLFDKGEKGDKGDRGDKGDKGDAAAAAVRAVQADGAASCEASESLVAVFCPGGGGPDGAKCPTSPTVGLCLRKP